MLTVGSSADFSGGYYLNDARAALEGSPGSCRYFGRLRHFVAAYYYLLYSTPASLFIANEHTPLATIKG